MQDKLESYSDFLERTDRLAAVLGVTVSDLTSVLHLSNGMLFAYRNGKYPISSKAWNKLESAERIAGITPIRVADPPPASELAVTKPPDPTKAGCMSHLAAYLDIVEAVPGGVAHTWVQLQLQFPLAQAAKMTELAEDVSAKASARAYLEDLKRRAEKPATTDPTVERKRA